MQRADREHRGDRRAVRHGDHARPRPAVQRLRVNVGHDERTRGVHTERTGVVDADRAMHPGDLGQERTRRGGARRDERDVDAGRGLDRQLAHLDVAIAERHSASGAARRGERHELVDREPTLLQDPRHLPAHRAGRSDHRDLHTRHPIGST